MKKSRLRSKDIVRVVFISALAIGLSAIGIIGINNLAFASATSQSEAVAPIEVTADTMSYIDSRPDMPVSESEVMDEADAAEEPLVYEAPVITVLANSEQFYNSIPDSAIPMDEAAQIGARYIWDVTGESTDGMYFTMMYTDWPSSINTNWGGSVYLTKEGAQEEFDLENIGNWEMPVFEFMIDAVTGARVDISYNKIESTPRVRDVLTNEDWNNWVEQREAIAVFAMDENELIAHFGITTEELELNLNAAAKYAQRHFSNSKVVSVILGQTVGDGNNSMRMPGITFYPARDENGNIYTSYGSFAFTVTDDTGREAYVNVNLKDESFSIRTQHNDQRSGYNFTDNNDPGVG